MALFTHSGEKRAVAAAAENALCEQALTLLLAGQNTLGAPPALSQLDSVRQCIVSCKCFNSFLIFCAIEFILV